MSEPIPYGSKPEKEAMKIEIKMPKKSTVLFTLSGINLTFMLLAFWIFRPVFLDWLCSWYCPISGWTREAVESGSGPFVGMLAIPLALTSIFGGFCKSEGK